MDVEKMRKYLSEFARGRGWEKYRTPKNLSMALSVEVAELVEIFQWMDNEQPLAVKKNDEVMLAVKEELADILSYLILFKLQIYSILTSTRHFGKK